MWRAPRSRSNGTEIAAAATTRSSTPAPRSPRNLSRTLPPSDTPASRIGESGCSRSNAIEREGEIASFTRVIETRSAIRLVATAAKNQEVGGPSATRRLAEKTGDIVRANRALESVKEKESRGSGRSLEPMEVDEVAVGGFPALDPGGKRRVRAKKLSPERLCVCPGYPPRGAVDILASTIG